jgi:acyl-CoA thioesterase FadM
LHSGGLALGTLLQTKGYLMPIVHVESNYSAPLRVGDQLQVHLHVAKVGNSSFTLGCNFVAGEKEVGSTAITHVIMCKQAQKSIPIPLEMLQLLGQ